MQEKNSNNDKDFLNINLLDLIKLIYKEKIKIILVTLIFAIFSIYYALGIKNQYTSYAILLPSTEGSSLSSLARQYSGLASIAGIDIPNSANPLTAPQLAEEQLKSLTFFTKYLYDDILVELMAGEEWDKKSNSLIINQELYDSDQKNWIRDVKWPLTVKPSAQEAHYRFLTHVSSELEKSGKLTIFVKHVRPDTAKQWLEIIINAFQEDNKQRNISLAKESIEFLEKEYEKTEIKELKEIISNLLADSIQKLSVSSIEGDNLFLIIQEPFSPLIKTSPNRAIICISITLLGLFLAILFFIFKSFIRDKKIDIKKFFEEFK